MTYQTILYDTFEGVATITLNRPEVMNALSTTMYRELDHAITEVESDDEVKAEYERHSESYYLPAEIQVDYLVLPMYLL